MIGEVGGRFWSCRFSAFREERFKLAFVWLFFFFGYKFWFVVFVIFLVVIVFDFVF